MDHAQLCAAAAAALASLPGAHRPEVVIGFDGFIDSIIDVVAKREDSAHYAAMATIAEFGSRVSEAAGKSANFELVVKQSKIGGNGPIMANALAAFDHQVTAIGLLGAGAIEPAFQPLVRRAKRVISLGPPGTTDALEFSDGKLMLGKVLPMDGITYERLLDQVGKEQLRALLRDARAVATVNWTMTLGLTTIWRRLVADILPGLRPDRPLWFIDLADPAKRTLADCREALDAIRGLQRHVDVVLGMNEMELRQVLATLGEDWPAGADELSAARSGCETVRNRLGIAWAVCHLVKAAAAASRHGSTTAVGFFAPQPMITTGAGDHFNAGFLAALIAGFEPQLCLQIGAATSGYYVRTGVSPGRAEVETFLRQHAAARA